MNKARVILVVEYDEELEGDIAEWDWAAIIGDNVDGEYRSVYLDDLQDLEVVSVE